MNSKNDKWLHTGDMVMVQSGHVGHAAGIPERIGQFSRTCFNYVQTSKGEN